MNKRYEMLEYCMLRKQAGAGLAAWGIAKDIIGSIKNFGKDVASAAVKTYEKVGPMGYAVAGLSGTALAFALARLASPEGTAKNADRFVINETLTSSLAKSIRDRDRLIREQNAKSGAPYKRDKFLS